MTARSGLVAGDGSRRSADAPAPTHRSALVPGWVARTAVVLAVICESASGSTAWPGPLVEALRDRQARIDAILRRNVGDLPSTERTHLEEALVGAFDFDEMAHAALIDWERRTPAQRLEYSHAFERLIRASLMRRIDIYRIDAVEYGPERVTGNRGLVDTVVRSRNATTEVRWSFVKSGSAWRIADYAIDGVSTTRNYRTQFTRIAQRNGWEGLLDRIRKRAQDVDVRGDGNE